MRLQAIVCFGLTSLALPAGPAAAQDCGEGQRLFEHYAGETCVPDDPQRIVTLQDQNALLPLTELGVRPVGSAGHIAAEGERIFRRMEGYDTSGIEWIGTYGGPPEPEAVAAMEPDLIVASPWPTGAPELYGHIAPVVVIDMFEQPLTDALFQFADLVGRTERAEELQAEMESHMADVRAALGPALDSTTLSFVEADLAEGLFYPVGEGQAMGVILRGLQPVRPEAERDLGKDNAARSIETIGDHEADVMFLLVYDADKRGDSDAFAAFTSHPLVQATQVAQAGQIVPLDGSAMVGSAWGKVMNGLDQISETLAREDLNRDLVAE
ncbi:ABC transporter substrate-binding protein [Pseudoroseicyclus tamaricis]|uniref:ABC transporter substrate-binding protein n=1 Tax=Pseudoroseicyclus tamaricis TaxID=2705421 RepID=A0A6B2JT75_9RHOB|nr:ABC transporter substrate-binding protein [Pseudoroseicyclus tamaricis]NDV01230.1 ABC transporter substrate-binding protein [Pseudoroseicyclus tamaricis]